MLWPGHCTEPVCCCYCLPQLLIVEWKWFNQIDPTLQHAGNLTRPTIAANDQLAMMIDSTIINDTRAVYIGHANESTQVEYIGHPQLKIASFSLNFTHSLFDTIYLDNNNCEFPQEVLVIIQEELLKLFSRPSQRLKCAISLLHTLNTRRGEFHR